MAAADVSNIDKWSFSPRILDSAEIWQARAK